MNRIVLIFTLLLIGCSNIVFATSEPDMEKKPVDVAKIVKPVEYYTLKEATAQREKFVWGVVLNKERIYNENIGFEAGDVCTVPKSAVRTKLAPHVYEVVFFGDNVGTMCPDGAIVSLK